MAFFPGNPTVGQTYTIGNFTWTWDGSGWLKGAGSAALNTTVSTTAPTDPNPGDIWIDETDGAVYTYIDDGDTQQWIDIGQPGPAGGLGYTGSVGYTGSQGEGANVYDNPTQSTGFIALPAGTIEQRPENPGNGYIRFNTTSGFGEIYNASAGQWMQFGTPPTFNLEYLVVAGGGGGGGHNAGFYEGAGGGAGGLLTGTAAYSTDVLIDITVGAGGAGASLRGNQGSNSLFDTITCYGGGGGGGGGQNGGNGGSGGGRGHNGTSAGKGVYIGSTYLSLARQGYDGGISGGANNAGGAGGGATAKGQDGADGARGGDGLEWPSGSGTYYAGGGGGSRAVGTGGLGGGGTGQSNSAAGSGTAGQPNTGGGGGGGWSSGTNSGSAGGSGIVILKYPSAYTATFSAGLTASTGAAVGGIKTSTITAGTGTVIFSI